MITKLNCKSRALSSSRGLCRSMAHKQGQEGGISSQRAPRLAQAQRPLCPQGEISCAGVGVGGRKNKEAGSTRPRVLVQSPWGHGRHTASQRGRLQQGGRTEAETPPPHPARTRADAEEAGPVRVRAQWLCPVRLLRPHELQPSRLLCPWNFPGKNTGVGCHSLPQGISQTRDHTCVSCTAKQVLHC